MRTAKTEKSSIKFTMLTSVYYEKKKITLMVANFNNLLSKSTIIVHYIFNVD